MPEPLVSPGSEPLEPAMLRTRLNEDLKSALKAKDQPLAVSTLRLILVALKDRDIAARGKGNCDGIGEDDILELLQKMVRQRRDSIEAYEKAARLDLAEREAGEIEVIQRFDLASCIRACSRGATTAIAPRISPTAPIAAQFIVVPSADVS